jgi:hypothetical protein
MNTRTRRGLVELIASVACLVGVMTILVFMDPLVRERMTQLSYNASPHGVSRMSRQVEGVADAIVIAARAYSIDNTPLMVFTGVAIVLVIFMLRT